jgi:hypothetical protein
MLANFFRGGQLNGAGMRLFLGDAGLGQIINDGFRFDLEVTRQLIDPDLIRVCHRPRDLFFFNVFFRFLFVVRDTVRFRSSRFIARLGIARRDIA